MHPFFKAQLNLYRILMVALIGLLVGGISSFATIGFVESIDWLNDILLISALSRMDKSPEILIAVTLLVPTLGGLIVGLILRFGVESGKSLGPQDTIYAVQLRETLPSEKSGASSTLAALLSLGCGASVGQYGPLVYFGTLVGQLANRLRLGVSDMRSTAIACGVAAAISAAFNAPIAGLIYTHEVILRNYSLRTFTAVSVAVACGFIVANVIFKHSPLFMFKFEHSYQASEFLLFALEGFACGLLAIIFMKLLKISETLADRLTIPTVTKPMLAGFLLGIIALQLPDILGTGKGILYFASIPGAYGVGELSVLLLAKVLATALCIGFGFAGGVMGPALLIGILFGSLFAITMPQLLVADDSGLSVYVVCGMVAVASSVIGAPMTALLIIFELTQSYEITIAAMVTVAFSNLTTYHWYGRSYFDRKLEERGADLSQGRVCAFLKHHKVAEHATGVLPRLASDIGCGEALESLKPDSLNTLVVVDAEERFLGLTSRDRLNKAAPETLLGSLPLERGLVFDETTSLWDAMESIRDYIGEAVPLVDSKTAKYLGAMPESVVLSSYLDAVQDLRREEHEA